VPKEHRGKIKNEKNLEPNKTFSQISASGKTEGQALNKVLQQNVMRHLFHFEYKFILFQVFLLFPHV
jgi:hypothetical protein